MCTIELLKIQLFGLVYVPESVRNTMTIIISSSNCCWELLQYLSLYHVYASYLFVCIYNLIQIQEILDGLPCQPFHKTVNKVFKPAVVIFRVILLDQLNILVRGVPYPCVVFLGKTLYSHNVSSHPGVCLSIYRWIILQGSRMKCWGVTWRE